MKKIKQINNLIIKVDTSEGINYFGRISANKNYNKYSVWTPDGICWEDGLTLKEAEIFCKETKDFRRRKR